MHNFLDFELLSVFHENQLSSLLPLGEILDLFRRGKSLERVGHYFVLGIKGHFGLVLEEVLLQKRRVFVEQQTLLPLLGDLHLQGKPFEPIDYQNLPDFDFSLIESGIEICEVEKLRVLGLLLEFLSEVLFPEIDVFD